jgi:2-polyprenyl-3-methyl-5-hydroxy-6-metoxy-1,4-benzoquinol methylase
LTFWLRGPYRAPQEPSGLSMSDQLSYDRTSDVPKILGCNTRNVEYRWSIFKRAVDGLMPPANILDFGAGSLRESYYFAERGHRVTAVDLDLERMRIFASKYDWRGVAFHPQFETSIPAGEKFDVITAFDVIEHIANLDDILPAFRDALAPDGRILCTVPNRLTLIEMVNKKMLANGRIYEPGEAHLQFKTPQEWISAFASYGLETAEHKMAIGPFANTWYWTVYLAGRVADRASPRIGDAIRRLVSPRLMAAANKAEVGLSGGLSKFYGWNLIVLRKSEQTVYPA